MSKIVLQLESLTCPSCLQKIQNALEKQTGVENVKVLFNASKVKADFSSETTPEEIQNVIEKLGYDVQKVNVKEG